MLKPNENWPEDCGNLFSRILVPTDFSEVSSRAFRYALALAARFDSRIYLAHVVCNTPSSTADALRLAAEADLKKIAAALPAGSPSCFALAKEGRLWDSIERIVNKHEIDLIVTGTRGVGPRRHPFLGSGAEQIFRHATCPVLTIGPSVAAGAPSQIEFGSILFVTDFGPSAERAGAFAVYLARKYGGRLTCLHVLEDLKASGRPALEHFRQIHTQGMRQSLRATDRTFVPSELCVRFGDAAEQILNVAYDCAADLIVMGSKASAGWVGQVPFSTAYNVAARAPCPVLTVRAGKPANRLASEAPLARIELPADSVACA